MAEASNIRYWIAAARPRTLPLAMASIAMGGFLAAYFRAFNWTIFLLTVGTTVGLQVLSNFSNDYGDSVHGADHQQRVGPSRMVQSGVISLNQMKMAMWTTGVLTFILGLLLIINSLGFNNTSFYFFLFLGLVAIFAAINYTSGSKPYGYSGWGDFSVLLFFGVVAVLGSYYLQTGSFEWLNILPALSCGLFATAVLNVNNIRDISSDRQAGKYSIPVRVGKPAAIRYHWALLVIGLVSSLVFVALNFQSFWQLLFLVISPLLIINGQAVSNKESSELDPYLKQMALTTLLYVLVFGLGLVLSS